MSKVSHLFDDSPETVQAFNLRQYLAELAAAEEARRARPCPIPECGASRCEAHPPASPCDALAVAR